MRVLCVRKFSFVPVFHIFFSLFLSFTHKKFLFLIFFWFSYILFRLNASFREPLLLKSDLYRRNTSVHLQFDWGLHYRPKNVRSFSLYFILSFHFSFFFSFSFPFLEFCVVTFKSGDIVNTHSILFVSSNRLQYGKLQRKKKGERKF